jgi:AcrR family transcriptional regulator
MLLVMGTKPVALDRRQRRRQETITEVLDIAAEIMAEQGVAGLSLGEVARRMGIRPPSLYVYFPSKDALYDALFARGAQLVLEHVREHTGDDADGRSLEAVLLDAAQLFVRWSVAHPPYTQLLFWRPVPGFSPTEEAYAPAVELIELTMSRFSLLQQRGLIRPDADLDDVGRDWTVLIAGVISQQLANEPDTSFASGRFTGGLPSLVAMFVQHYGTTGTTGTTSPQTSRKEPRRVRTR